MMQADSFWVFGYGSLMSDGWESAFGCTRRVWADLVGFSRAFNKASIVNWGSKEHPGPTLNIVACEGATCHGIAFEFPVARESDVLAYLAKREGKGFPLRPLTTSLSDGQKVTALAPIYEGQNPVNAANVAELAAMVNAASGTLGQCRNYVIRVAADLQKMGISDPVVDELVNALKA